jgi:zinc protease
MIHEFTTPNGLKVIGIESHKSPVVSVQIWVRNGSADERAGEEGISHFIEHLLFKGTQKFKVGEIAGMVEACGGEINAYTSYDQTVYYITISKNFFANAMDAIYEMIAHPLFDAGEIDKEREVVIEEIKRSHDSLSRRASRLLFSSMYVDYPYQVPVIGYDHVVNTVTPVKIREFFKERYSTENMFLVVSGDFEPEDLKRETDEKFARIPRTILQERKRNKIQTIETKTVKVEQAPFEDTVLYISWPGTDVLHKDVAALECLGLILGQGTSSRLVRKLRLEEPVVKSIGAGSWTPTTQGFFSISSSFNPVEIDKVLVGVKNVLETFFEFGATAEELYKAKINFLSDEAYSLETVGGLAQKFGGNYDVSEDIYYHKKFYQNLEGVTLEDIHRVACTYLSPEKMLITCVVPKDVESVEKKLNAWTYSQPKFKSSEQKVQEVHFKSPVVNREDAAALESEVHVGGLKTFYRKSAVAPVFNMRFAILGGSRVVAKEKAGLTELVSRVWAAQTKTCTEEIYREKLDRLASSVYAFTGKNTFGLVVDGLKESEHELAEIFSETIFNYDIDEGMLEREKKMVLESRRARKDSPAQVAILNFNKTMFANHPYGVDSLGEDGTLESVSKKDVEKYIQKYFQSASSVCALSGDFSKDIWKSRLDEVSKKFSDKKIITAEKFPIAPLGKNHWLYERAEKEQTHIVYGFRGETITSPDRYALQIMEAILAGQGGRLFLELRDKASLAYSVSPLRLEGIETGYFATYIGCSPDKADTALKMMNEELMKLANTEVNELELSRAKNYLIGGHDIGLQRNSSLSSAIAFNEVYGISAEEVFEYADRLQDVSAKDVQMMAQKLFMQKHVISIVGSKEPDAALWS